MKKAGFLARAKFLLLCLISIAIGMGFSLSPEATNTAKKPAAEQKEEMHNGRKIEKYSITFEGKKRNFQRLYYGTRTELWKKLESGELPLRETEFNTRYERVTPTVSMIENLATDIVLGSFSEDITLVKRADKDVLLSSIDVSQFKVEKVFKGAIKAGDTIDVSELYKFQDYNHTEHLWCNNSYLPSRANTQYLFFFKKIPETDFFTPGAYEPILLMDRYYYGRFQVLTEEQKKLGLENIPPEELSVHSFRQNYIDLYPQVAKKYGI